MNHRIFFLLSAFAVVYGVRAQGYLESERWLGYAKPTTEVYYDEADKRLLLVDQQLDYLQLRYAAKGKGLKPLIALKASNMLYFIHLCDCKF